VGAEISALPKSKVVGFDPIDFTDGDGSATVKDVMLVLRGRRHDWEAAGSGVRAVYFANMLRKLLHCLRQTKVDTGTSIVAAAPALRTSAKPKPVVKVEQNLPPASGVTEPLNWLVYLSPDGAAASWTPEQLAGHFGTLRGFLAVRTIGQGFFGLDFSPKSRTDVAVQLTTSSLSVPASTIEWRLLSDRVVYARQASAGDNIILYPVSHRVVSESEGNAESVASSAPQISAAPTNSRGRSPDASASRAKPAKGVPVKKGPGKKLDPMIGKWKAARAEIVEYERIHKKTTEMSLEELNEAKEREIAEWKRGQDSRYPLLPPLPTILPLAALPPRCCRDRSRFKTRNHLALVTPIGKDSGYVCALALHLHHP